MAKTREQQLKSVITYELEPEEVQKTLIKGVLSGFAAMNNAIIVDAKDLPKIINRQTFCLLTGIKPSKLRYGSERPYQSRCAQHRRKNRL